MRYHFWERKQMAKQQTTYDNTGAMFVNDKKEQPNHPDYNGTVTIDGVEYWLSGWKKQGREKNFVSLAFKRKDEAKGGGKSAPAAKSGQPQDEFDF